MKVLFFSASTGGGHIKAANALSEYIKRNDTSADVLNVDTIRYASPVVDKIIVNAYINTLKTTPKIYGKLYDITDEGDKLGENLNGLSNSLGRMFSYKIKRLVRDFLPDVIVCTHPFALHMVQSAKKKLGFRVPVIAIVTDYAVHPLWVKGEADAYIIAHEYILNDAMNKGIPRDKIYPYGIPIEDKFLYHRDRAQVLKKFGLQDMTTFLIMGGSLGFGEIEKIFVKLIKVRRPLQIVVVTGKNKKLKMQLDRYVENNDIEKNVSILGYLDDINDLMDISDCIMTKPGGLTVTEALAKEVPICIISPIPGQEEKNATFLINAGVAARLREHDSVEDFLCQVIDNTTRYNSMKSIARILAKPNACADTYNLIKHMIENFMEKI